MKFVAEQRVLSLANTQIIVIHSLLCVLIIMFVGDH